MHVYICTMKPNQQTEEKSEVFESVRHQVRN